MRSDALEAIRAAKLRRLEELELRQATMGRATDPADTTEIEDLRAQLGILDSGSNAHIDYETRRAIRSVDQHDFNLNVLASLVQRLTRVEEVMQSLTSQSQETRRRVNVLIIVIALIAVAIASYLWGAAH